MQKYSAIFVLFLIFSFQAELASEVLLGPNYYEVKVVDNGDEVEKRSMCGGRVDYYFDICYGFIYKGTLSYNFNTDGHNEYLLLSDNRIGYTVPVSSCWSIRPILGLLVNVLDLSVDIPFMGITGLKEVFRNYCPYGGVEGVYKLSRQVSLGGSYAYGVNFICTELDKELISENSAQMHLFSLMAAYDYQDWISLSIHGACNQSHSDEHYAISWWGGWLAFSLCY